MAQYFPEIKKNFGFGCMRLKMDGNEVDLEEFSRMVDAFMMRGFNYFDTAKPYIDGKSELAIKACLTSRYPRDRYVLTNKLSNNFFSCKEDIEPLLDAQLAACGVDYFDFYLMHAQNKRYYEHFKACDAYDEAFRLKEKGKIRHVGLSFHDTPDFLDLLLTENPQIEVVQIQFNYADFEDEKIRSRECYEVCRKHGKPIIVMEPVKGGSLVNMPDAVGQVLDDLHSGSRASYAIRFAASFEGIIMVLSGMGNMAMMEDNLSYMEHFRPLNDTEMQAVQKAAAIYRGEAQIPCTGCRYCVEGCPQQIPIPDVFHLVNQAKITGTVPALSGLPGGSPDSCVNCGKCEKSCPQFLPIRMLLRKISNG